MSRPLERFSLGKSFVRCGVLLPSAAFYFDPIFLYFVSLQVAKLPQVVQQQATVGNIQQMVSVSQQVGFALVKYTTRNMILKKLIFWNVCIFHLMRGIGSIF